MSDHSPWICIARTGTFKDSGGIEHTFTGTDLEKIRANYDPAISEAPLVFGHPKDSAPAYGWVSALKTEGQKLYAQFAHVPEAVKQLVQNRAYRYVSMSLAPDKSRLLHVGLLGAAAPAIDGLGAVSFSAGRFYRDTASDSFLIGGQDQRVQPSLAKTSSSLSDGKLAPQEKNLITVNFSANLLAVQAQQENYMNPEELQRQIGALSAQVDALKVEIESLKNKLAESDKNKIEAETKQKTAEEAAAKSAAEFTAFKGKVEGDKRSSRIRALVDSGRLEPAKEMETLSFAAALASIVAPVNFSAADGKTEQISAEERYLRELEARPVDPRFAMNFSTPAPAHAATDKAVDYAEITNKL